MEQVISVLDGQGYWPMVRQIFVQRVERAPDGMTDEAVIAAALPKAARCLAALDALLESESHLAGQDFSLAKSGLDTLPHKQTSAAPACFSAFSRRPTCGRSNQSCSPPVTVAGDQKPPRAAI